MIHGDSDYAMILIICFLSHESHQKQRLKTESSIVYNLSRVIRSLNNDPDEGNFTKLSFQKKKTPIRVTCQGKYKLK